MFIYSNGGECIREKGGVAVSRVDTELQGESRELCERALQRGRAATVKIGAPVTVGKEGVARKGCVVAKQVDRPCGVSRCVEHAQRKLTEAKRT